MTTKTVNIDPSYVPSTKVTTIPASSPLSEIQAIMERDGCVILSDFTTHETLDTIATELDGYKENELTTYDLYNRDEGIEFSAKENKTLTGVCAKSDTLCDLVENHPVLDEVRTSMLHEEFEVYLDDQIHKLSIPPLLSAGLRIKVTQGGTRQALHRDDQSHATVHDYGDKFELNKEGQVGVIIAASECVRENGATLLVLGSHKWPDSQAPRLDQVTFGEMKRGSALFFLASMFHASGANTLPEPRDVYLFFFTRGRLRQEENAFLTYPQSKVLKMSDKMLSLLGFKRTVSGLGQVNNDDPTMTKGYLAKIMASVNLP